MNNLDISFNDEVNFLKDSDKDWIPWISNLLLSAKKEIHKENTQEMSINFVSSKKIHEINKKYRGKDRPTDVISFAIEDGLDEDFMSAFSDDPGFVALIGRPNVGKSTLLNYLVGQKVAIMSPQPQTTRNKISGIYTDDQEQIVFIDTPGIHKPKNKLDDFMDKSSYSALDEVDVVLFMVEPEPAGKGDQYIAELLKKIKKPVFLVINKIDKVHPDELLSIIDSYKNLGDFAEIVPISASQGNNVSELIKTIAKYLPEGPQFYDADQLTDRPEYFIVAELIREQVLKLTHEEVPHATAVVVDRMRDHEGGKLQVEATIYVERPGQKGIIIGKKGQMLKQIEIEALLGEKVNLRLWVKVQKNWRSDPAFLKSIGYNAKELR